jgi:hypothetical protein
LHDAIPGARLVGYDVAAAAIQCARSSESERLSFECGDLLALPLSGDRFDLLLAIDVVEHVEDYLGFLRRLRERANAFVFHIPLDLSVQSVLRPRRLIAERQTVGHLHYFTAETALATLKDAGYSVVDWRFTAASLELPVRSALARVAKLPRRAIAAVSPAFAARLLGGSSLLALARVER